MCSGVRDYLVIAVLPGLKKTPWLGRHVFIVRSVSKENKWITWKDPNLLFIEEPMAFLIFIDPFDHVSCDKGQ